MGGLRGLDGMREEGTVNLLGNEGRGITSGEEGLSEVSGFNSSLDTNLSVFWIFFAPMKCLF